MEVAKFAKLFFFHPPSVEFKWFHARYHIFFVRPAFFFIEQRFLFVCFWRMACVSACERHYDMNVLLLSLRKVLVPRTYTFFGQGRVH